MTSVALDNSTLAVELTHINQHGLWVFIGEEELFLSFALFPWFEQAPIAKVLKVEAHSASHLHWPELDIDLSLESIRQPELFPLVSRSH